MYHNEEYVSKGATAFHRKGSTVDQITMFSENYNPLERLDTEHLYKLEVLDICTSGAIWACDKYLLQQTYYNLPFALCTQMWGK